MIWHYTGICDIRTVQECQRGVVTQTGYKGKLKGTILRELSSWARPRKNDSVKVRAPMWNGLGSWGITIYVVQMISNIEKTDFTATVCKFLKSPLKNILFQNSSCIYAALRNTLRTIKKFKYWKMLK